MNITSIFNMGRKCAGYRALSERNYCDVCNVSDVFILKIFTCWASDETPNRECDNMLSGQGNRTTAGQISDKS
jgi:hypothetical protein